MKKTIKTIMAGMCLICLAMCSSTCDNLHLGPDCKLKVKNNAPYTIYANSSLHYPDTTYAGATNLPYSPSATIEPGNVDCFMMSPNWESAINNNPHGIVLVFVVNLDSARKYGWELDEHYHLLRRYDLTVNDLEQMNWTVTYP